MRPPTPRLRINSEDFIDNDNGPPCSSDTQFLSLHSQNSNLTYSTNNTRDNNTSTNAATSAYTDSQAIISSYDEKIAVLVADSDIQEISVL